MKASRGLQALAPDAVKKLKVFLEGLPRRYLRTFRAEEILQHLELSAQSFIGSGSVVPGARTALV